MISSKKDCHKGYLLKWTNYIRGYQKRWFVVSNGLLSYYRNQQEVSHTCRGTINLATAQIKVVDSLNIILSNEGNQTYHLRTFSVEDTPQWASSLISAKKTAIRLNEAVLVLEDDSDTDSRVGLNYRVRKGVNSTGNGTGQLVSGVSTGAGGLGTEPVTREFDMKLYDLKNSVSLVKKNSESLLQLLRQLAQYSSSGALNAAQWALTHNHSINSELCSSFDLEPSQSQAANHNNQHQNQQQLQPDDRMSLSASCTSVVSSPNMGSQYSVNDGSRTPPNSLQLAPSSSAAAVANLSDLIQKIRDRNKVFSVSTQACVNTCSEFVNKIVALQTFYQKQLGIERDQRLRLENMVEELAKQLGALEKRAAKQLDNDVPAGVPHGKNTDDGGRSKTNNDPNSVDESDEDHFFDAIEDEHMFNVSLPRAMSPSNMMEPKYKHNEYESCGSSDYESEQENLKSNSIARVIVRSTEKKSPIKKSNSSKKTKSNPKIAKTKSHRRTASSGCSGERKQNKDAYPSFRTAGNSGSANSPSSSTTATSTTTTITSGNSPDVVSVDDSSTELYQSTSQPLTGVSQPDQLKTAYSVPSLVTVAGTAVSNNTCNNTTARVRRDRIPPRPNVSVNLWGIMKNCIGKELSKIPVPVNFNEPLSMLQRLTEDLEYTCCLDSAAGYSDPIEQLAWVAAYTVSSYSTTTTRTGKPFNPFLGETFECDRTADPNYGWRSIAEQVSHHPPAAALHAESPRYGWRCWQEFTMSSKFRGKYLAIVPLGTAHLTFANSGNHYTWRKVTSTVHNIIVGRLWIDNHGEMDIYNHNTGDVCHLNYKAYSYFSREPARRVTGVITDKHGVTKYVLNGTWDEYFEGAKVLEIRRDKNNQQIFETGPTKTLWKRNYPPNYTSEMYNFTLFTLTLNEMEDDVSPTDSRRRPDQRLMEVGQWDEANKIKERLEEKQREKRKLRERENETRKREGLPEIEHTPQWFESQFDEETNQPIYMYKGNYWETKAIGKWSPNLPDIF